MEAKRGRNAAVSGAEGHQSAAPTVVDMCQRNAPTGVPIDPVAAMPRRGLCLILGCLEMACQTSLFWGSSIHSIFTFLLLLHTESHTFAYTAHTSYTYIPTYTPLNAKPQSGPVYSYTELRLFWPTAQKSLRVRLAIRSSDFFGLRHKKVVASGPPITISRTSTRTQVYKISPRKITQHVHEYGTLRVCFLISRYNNILLYTIFIFLPRY